MCYQCYSRQCPYQSSQPVRSGGPCVCVFSFVTPRSHDYAAERGTCGTYIGFVKTWRWTVSQSGVGVLWGLCLEGVFYGIRVWLGVLSLSVMFEGLLVSVQPSPRLPSSVGSLFGLRVLVRVVLCLSMAFVVDMNFIRCFSVPTNLSSWAFLPVPSEG